MRASADAVMQSPPIGGSAGGGAASAAGFDSLRVDPPPEFPAAALQSPMLRAIAARKTLEPLDLDATPPDTVGGRLRGRLGKEVVVSVRREAAADAADGPAESLELDLLLKPISNSAVRRLVYEATQRRRAALVHEWSDGRLGYTHVRSMDQASLDAEAEARWPDDADPFFWEGERDALENDDERRRSL